MCTVTIIPLSLPSAPSSAARGIESGMRLACNRDESRRRPAAMPPEVRCYGSRKAILPIDPVSDGTWIAVNDAGLTLTLLNAYQPAEHTGSSPPPEPKSAGLTKAAPHSRGMIIPALLHLPSVADVAANMMTMIDPAEFPPFRLVAVDSLSAVDAHGDGERLHIAMIGNIEKPLLFTSSGLGDHIVEGPRRALFEESFQREQDWPVQQEAYHRHSWPDRRDISVCMSRVKARTVSFTLVQVTSAVVAMHYHPEAPDTAAKVLSLCLPRIECSA